VLPEENNTENRDTKDRNTEDNNTENNNRQGAKKQLVYRYIREAKKLPPRSNKNSKALSNRNPGTG